MRFTLKQLQVFLAVASFENVSLAADELAMSQSAASTALKELEHRLDLRLFDRIGKRLQLNEQGIALRSKAAALIAGATELENTLIGASDIGELKVGATLQAAAAAAAADSLASRSGRQLWRCPR